MYQCPDAVLVRSRCACAWPVLTMDSELSRRRGAAAPFYRYGASRAWDTCRTD